MENVIIGGGIAGLIWAYYNKDHKVLSPDFGGQMNHHFALGPRYLHDTPKVRKFLKSLKMPVEKITVKIGFWDGNKVMDEPPNDEFVAKYLAKSRGKQVTDATAVSQGHRTFEALKVDFQELIKRLTEASRSRLVKGKARQVLSKAKMLVYEDEDGKEQVMRYDKLVSTIPLNFLCEMLGEQHDLESNHVTYVMLHSTDIPLTDHDYVYVPDEEHVFHRVTNGNDKVVVDWFGAHNEEECKEKFGKAYIESHVLWGAQLIPTQSLYVFEDIRLVGRYGTWDRKWKTETVIEEAMKED